MAIKNLDQNLLRLLEADARASVSVLAAKLGVSRATVRNRMEKLEDGGTIQGYTVRYADEYERNRVRAHVMLSVATDASAQVETAIRKMNETRALYTLAGDYDLLAIVEADNTTLLDRALDDLRGLDGVDQTHTSIILATRFRR